jgi:acyl dehydratase
VGLYFEDFEIDKVYVTASRTVTEADVVIYTGLSADYNALHTDEEYAKTTTYGTRIAQGPLIFCMAMGLMNRMGLTEGTSLGFLSIENWRFTSAVKFGDTITVRFRVASKRLTSKGDRGVLTRAIEIINARGETIQEGSIVTMVKARARPSGAAATA